MLKLSFYFTNYCILTLLLLGGCTTIEKTSNLKSVVEEITLNDYYLYEVEFKDKSEDYYGLILSKHNYSQDTSIDKIIKNAEYFLVDKVSFHTYFDMKDENYSIDDFQDCEEKIDYKEELVETFEDKSTVINVLKISGIFFARSTYSGWYNSHSTAYININKSRPIKVIYAACK